MASAYEDRDKGTIQVLAGNHLDRMSDHICQPGHDTGELAQQIMWLDVLAHPIAAGQDEVATSFRARFAALTEAQEQEMMDARDGVIDEDPRVLTQRHRYEQARLIVKLLFDKNILRESRLPWDDVSDLVHE